MHKPCKKEGGFTFIEVIIAVTLLAVGASLIIGLQSASVQSQLHDRMSQQAMLAARRILAVVEIKEMELDFTEKSGTALSVLSDLKIPESEDPKEREMLEKFDVLLTVEDWALPEVDKAAMRKVYLRISWGDQPYDKEELVYFIPNEQI